jgi:hypothetical protein
MARQSRGARPDSGAQLGLGHASAAAGDRTALTCAILMVHPEDLRPTSLEGSSETGSHAETAA